MTVLLGLAVLTPLVLAVGMVVTSIRPFALRVAPWAAVPALVLALASAGSAVEVRVPWLFVATTLGVDATAWPFLLATAVLWLAAGVYASGYLAIDPRRHRFQLCFLAAMAGNVGFVLSHDLVSAYAAYTLMSLATYGLVAHAATSEAMRAARVYIAMAILSEVVLLVGAALCVAAAGGAVQFAEVAEAVASSPWRDLTWACLVVGFGVKAGVLILHIWLPLAHSIAPTPASAVLSGAMVKVGVLGWLRVLPTGTPLPDAGTVLVVIGLGGALYGVAIGLTQRTPKSILAYSTVSQMGILTAALGGLLHSSAGLRASGALGMFVLHHALVKGAMFLGVGVAQATRTRAQVIGAKLGLVVLALTLVGAPLTGGALAKVALKSAVAPGLGLALTLTSVGTALLMARFLAAAWPHAHDGREATPREWIAWGSTACVGAMLPWLLAPAPLLAKASSWAAIATATWPVLLGGALVVALRKRVRSIPHVPTGDLAGPIGALAGAVSRALAEQHRTARAGRSRPRWPWADRFAHASERLAVRIEGILEQWRALLAGFLVLVGLVAAHQAIRFIGGA